MTPSKPANLAEVERLMAEWSLLQRVRLIASLMHECTEASEPHTVEWSALGDILGEKYKSAIQRCDGNWEPPDDPEAWSGGFAENH